MEIEPNISWYLSLSREREVEPRCPFSTVERCPRYLDSLSLLKHMGYTSISEDEYQQLRKRWKDSEFIPRIAEYDTSVSGSDISKCMSNYCPEVSYESFGFFASQLCQIGDALDKEIAYARLSNLGIPESSWQWKWLGLKPMHYTECPLYSPLIYLSVKDASGKTDATPNHEKEPPRKQTIHIHGSNARVNIDSTDNSMNVVHEGVQFPELRDAIESAVSDEVARAAILERLSDLEAATDHESGTKRYQAFITAAANHMTIIGPYLPILGHWVHNLLETTA